MLDRREQDIVNKAQRGDRRAFGELVIRYQNLVTSIAFSKTGDLQRSEDIAQQVFLIAWKKRTELRDPTRFGGWLRSITRHVTMNSNRKSQRLDRSASTLEAKHEPESADLPDDQLATQEQQELLWASLQNIPEEYREPLILFYREDQSAQQVAEQMGLSVAAVKQRLVRGRAMLKSEVEQFVEDLLGSTKPRAAFASAVLAALPAVSAATGQAAVKGGFLLGAKSILAKLGLAGSGTFAGVLGGVLGGVIGVWGAWYGTKSAAKYATSEKERELLWWFFRTIIFMTAVLAVVSIGVSFLLSGKPVFFFVVGSTILYTILLTGLIISFVNRQSALHEKYGKPAYPSEFDDATPMTPAMFRVASISSTIGCWVWVFVLAGIHQDWIVIGIAIALLLGHLAWLLMITSDVRTTLPVQMRMLAKSLTINAGLAAVLVSAAGFLGSRLDLSPTQNWAVALGVFVLCSLAAGAIWYGAGKMEQSLAAKIK